MELRVMDTWNKQELLDKYPIRNTDFQPNYVIGYGDAYWYPGMPSNIVTFNENTLYDPWNRTWENDTKWNEYDPYKDTYFRWVTVDKRKIGVYLIQKNYSI